MSLLKSNFANWPTISDFFDDELMKGKFNGDWSPAVNVMENEGNYEIEVAAPGLKKEDFSVSIESGVLTIIGETKKEEEEKRKNYTRKEFSSKSFTKSFTLPNNVVEDEVSAKYEEGVLKLTIHKTEKDLPPRKQVLIT